MNESDILISIQQRLTNIEEILSQIKDSLKPVEKSCMKMQSHISFVEGTYENIKGSLTYYIPGINNSIPKLK